MDGDPHLLLKGASLMDLFSERSEFDGEPLDTPNVIREMRAKFLDMLEKERGRKFVQDVQEKNKGECK